MTHRILLDVTELAGLRLHTGVQRVVRELWTGLSARPDVELVPVVADAGRLWTAGAPALALLEAPPPAGSAPATDRGRVRRLAEGVLARVPAVYARVQQHHFRRRMPAMLAPFRGEPLAVGTGDVLVAADTFWTGSDIVAAAGWARGEGAAVVTLVYDMIPWTHPALAGPGLSRSFPRLLRALLARSDGVLTISHFSAGEIGRFLHEHGLSRPVGVFYLGSDAGTRSAPVAPGVWPDGLWSPGGRTIVTVGTIEPRKGHDTILAAFDARWRAGSGDRLLMIGKPGAGAGSAALRAALETHPERGRRLFALGNVDDAMLADAYARADAGIIASRVEGFGLPLVEALSRGLPMVASDIPVFRELAGDRATYFAVGDADALCRALDRVGDRSASVPTFTWADWTRASAQFLDQIERLV